MPIQSKQQPPYYKQGTNVQQFIAQISQTATDAPVNVILLNTTDATTWQYVAEGEYALNGTFPQEKTYISGFGDWADAANPYMPLFNGTAIVGYYTLYANGDAIKMFVENTSGTKVDLNTLIGTTKLYLPTILVFN